MSSQITLPKLNIREKKTHYTNFGLCLKLFSKTLTEAHTLNVTCVSVRRGPSTSIIGVDWSLLITWMFPPPAGSIPSARLWAAGPSVVLSALAKVSNALQEKVINNERMLKKFRAVLKLTLTSISTLREHMQELFKLRYKVRVFITTWPLCTVQNNGERCHSPLDNMPDFPFPWDEMWPDAPDFLVQTES